MLDKPRDRKESKMENTNWIKVDENGAVMTDDQIKYMVNRFLMWRLPDNFNPDGGISFKRTFNEHTSHPMKHEPVGTNLLDFTQAEQMIRHLIEGMPSSRQGSIMSEKQASSEIAQSRDAKEIKKFLRTVPINLADSDWKQVDQFIDAAVENAERDTRERCAQQGRSLLELVLDVTLQVSSKKNEILDTFERRIRGKE